MLVNLKMLMEDAEKNHYAVGAFNTPNLESIRAVIEAAEETGCPVILNHAQNHDCFIPIEEIAPIMLQYAEKSHIPICLHIDHGEDMNFIMRAIRAGFTSVMYDCSGLPFDENVLKVKALVELAHPLGISVEAELGQMLDNDENGLVQNNDKRKYFTSPDQAARFCELTKVDALAIAFGSVHGEYKFPPELDIELLQSIRRSVPVTTSLVMHGGSGTPPDQLARAIREGIRKINYFSVLNTASTNTLKETCGKYSDKSIHFVDLSAEITSEIKKKCIETIQFLQLQMDDRTSYSERM